MHKNNFSVFFFLVILCQISQIHAKNFKFDFGAGYRHDHFSWELAGGEHMPSVASKVTWKNLHLFEVMGQLKKITAQKIYIRSYLKYGYVFHGKNTDSDFDIDNVTHKVREWSRSDNDATKGYVWDGSIALGYFIRDVCIDKVRVAPLVGYSYHDQHLHIKDGYQSIDIAHPRLEGHHFKGLHSTYNTSWKGPWVGADIYYHINKEWSISSALEYHWLQFRGKGHWNMRRDIAGDFTHTGEGKGFIGSLGVDYNFICGWYLGGYCSFTYAEVSKGNARTPMRSVIHTGVVNNACNNPEIPLIINPQNMAEMVTVKKDKLRSVKWYSFDILFSAGYNF